MVAWLQVLRPHQHHWGGEGGGRGGRGVGRGGEGREGVGRGSEQVATKQVQAVRANLSFQTSAAAFFPFPFPFCSTSFRGKTSCTTPGKEHRSTRHNWQHNCCRQVHGEQFLPRVHTLTFTLCRGPAAMLTTPSDWWRCRAISGSSSGSSWSGCMARCRTAWNARCNRGLNMSLGWKASHLPPSSSLDKGEHNTQPASDRERL